MIINFFRILPGGNDTIIVTSPVSALERSSIASLIIKKLVGVEQVGYLSYPQDSCTDARLDMMGGELCINGIRCVARILALKSSKAKFLIESSGSNQIFRCDVYLQNNKFFVKVSLNIFPLIQRLERDIFLVRLDNMSLLFCKYDSTNIKDSALEIFGKLKKRYQGKFKGLPAYGIVPFQGFNNRYRIFPVIYVEKTDTTILETGCGSASMALALALREEDNAEKFFITQPSNSTYELDVIERKLGIEVTLSSFVDIIDSATISI